MENIDISEGEVHQCAHIVTSTIPEINSVSSPPTHEQVLEDFFRILKKYRRAVLKNQPAGIRAFGEELKAFGGKWALKAGFWTVPMERLSFDLDPRVIQRTLSKEWEGLLWSRSRK